MAIDRHEVMQELAQAMKLDGEAPAPEVKEVEAEAEDSAEEEVESAEPEAEVEAEAPAEEASTKEEIQDAADDLADLKDVLDEDGENIDVDKLRKVLKSAQHAQSLVGKTAKDREEVKKIQEQYKGIVQGWQYMDSLAREFPELKAAIEKAHAIKSGSVKPSAAGSLDVSGDAKKQLEAAAKTGDVESVIQGYLDNHPEIQELRKFKQKVEVESQTRAQEEQRAALSAKLDKFTSDFGSLLFDKDGAPKDEELYNHWLEEVTATGDYEKAWYVVAAQRGIEVRPKKPDAQRATASKAGAMPRGKVKLPIRGRAKPVSKEKIAGIPADLLSQALDQKLAQKTGKAGK